MGVLDQPIQSDSNRFCCSISEKTYDASFVGQPDDDSSGKNQRRRGRHENDVLISEAMQKLSFEEREEQEEVLHGVDKDLPEEAEFVENALHELESHLMKRQTKAEESAYDLAERMNRDYVHARPFRIMFLRGNRYDTKATADQMLKFFEMKQQIFGTEKLTKDITIEDLDEDDISALKTEMTQLCGRDRSGRVVLIQFPSIVTFKNVKSEMRARYFFLMNALKSEQTQLKGFVFITYSVGEYKKFQTGLDGFPEVVNVTLKCPIFVAAIHFCCDDLREYFVCNLVLKALPEKLRTRIRLNYGSHLEIQYRLSTYGIHKDQLPFISNTFSVNREWYLQWFLPCVGDKLISNAVVVTTTARRNTKQASIELHPSDVLFMGGSRTNNGGNLYLKNLVSESFQTYESGTRLAKKRVVIEIINEIQRTGGRFLDQQQQTDPNAEAQQDVYWAVLPPDRVRLKISQIFRNHRRKAYGTRKKKTKLNKIP